MLSMRGTVFLVAVGFATPLMSGLAQAQTKVEAAVELQIATAKTARVIIKTRPDPDFSGGGLPAASPSAYLAYRLGGSTSARAVTANMAVTQLDAAGLDRLRQDPNVTAVYADIPVPANVFDSVPIVGGDRAQLGGFRGDGLSVAILDTGVDKTHPALTNAVIAEACFSSTVPNEATSLCPNGNDVYLLAGAAGTCPSNVNGCNHGTHVAGIAAGRTMHYSEKTFDGMAPRASVVAVQVFSLFSGPQYCGSQPTCVLSYPSDQLRALQWIYLNRQQLKVASINMSLGSGANYEPCDAASALTEEIERLRDKGIFTVISAGNSGFYAAVGMPGCISAALTVSATKKSGELDVSYANRAPMVDLVAPGTAIVSSVPGGQYESIDGTSMAAPHVAGAVALLRQMYPSVSADELQSILLNGAPRVQDPQTGALFPRLEVSHALPTTAARAPVGVAAAAANTPVRTAAAAASAPVGAAATGAAPSAPGTAVSPSDTARSSSFILRTTSSPAAVTSSVQSLCPTNNCSLRQIGNDAWRVDLPPPTDPTGRAGMTADEVRRALQLSPDTKVFHNTPAAPLSVR